MRVTTGKSPNSTGLCFCTTGGVRTKWAPVLGTEAVESLCLETPKSCLDVVLTSDSWWPCLGRVFGPGDLQRSLQPQPFCDSGKELDATLSPCPSLLRREGKNGASERKWGWPVFIGTQLLSSERAARGEFQ